MAGSLMYSNNTATNVALFGMYDPLLPEDPTG